ncbi:uncharacterized protein Gasu_07140 [Galdieria sulphuraria]|uniref:BZIP domain-containing protein n=1 Tax=Galdieria sulphuraria TaxID=130081 RepID=M2Y809_GALSU|nr:uncharacterized protein Gasu_07140 [Galdieria sulphuraria]EME31964.1 hypothetical protein Gasu_07140 [Galdieria sulphuraria]|eukprot:XP_005708484.1 hypothetical protein Gasu_07140 [Galdieria sulphuraria]
MVEPSHSSEEKRVTLNPMEPPVVSVTGDEQQALLSLLSTTTSSSSTQIKSFNGEVEPKAYISRDIFTLPSSLRIQKGVSTENVSASVGIASLSSERQGCDSKEVAGWYSSNQAPLTSHNSHENGKWSHFESSSQVPLNAFSASSRIPLNEEHYYEKSNPLLSTNNELSTIWKRGRKQKYAHLSADERKAIRAAQNREATRRSRERSRVRYEMMVEELNRLRKENAELWRTREVIIALLKQHNINIPDSVIEVVRTSGNLTSTKDFGDVSSCNEYYKSSFSPGASYPFSDLPFQEIPSRSTVLQPHM